MRISIVVFLVGGAIALAGCSVSDRPLSSGDAGSDGSLEGAATGGSGGSRPGAGGAQSGGSGGTASGGSGGTASGGSGGTEDDGGSGGTDGGPSCGDGFVEVAGDCVADACAEGAEVVCGAANTTCTVTAAGTAECGCASGYDDCGGACVDLDADPGHCGECDYACAGTLSCSGGACEQAVHQLVAGNQRTCALLVSPDGAESYPLRCWGSPDRGFFRGTPDDARLPSAIPGVARVRGMAMADSRYCVLNADEDVVSCWGDCAAECNPDVAVTENLIETNNSGATDLAVANGIVVNRGATCTVRSSNQLTCWGFAPMITDEIDRTTPTFIEVDGAAVSFTSVSAGRAHLCGTTTAGLVACWGDSYYNDTLLWGLPTPDPFPVDARYVQLEGGGNLTGVDAISASPSMTCAVTTDKDLYCWGGNQFGGLGVGDADPHVGAVQVDLHDVEQVSASIAHACAIRTGGQLYCWGQRIYVGLGEDAEGDYQDGTYFTTPEAVPGMDDVLEVSTGWSHTCARKRTGAVVCWGDNTNGQVGDGTAIQRWLPTPVSSLF